MTDEKQREALNDIVLDVLLGFRSGSVIGDVERAGKITDAILARSLPTAHLDGEVLAPGVRALVVESRGAGRLPKYSIQFHYNSCVEMHAADRRYAAALSALPAQEEHRSDSVPGIRQTDEASASSMETPSPSAELPNRLESGVLPALSEDEAVGWQTGFPTEGGGYLVDLGLGEFCVTYWNDGTGKNRDSWGDERRTGWGCLSGSHSQVRRWVKLDQLVRLLEAQRGIK